MGRSSGEYVVRYIIIIVLVFSGGGDRLYANDETRPRQGRQTGVCGYNVPPWSGTHMHPYEPDDDTCPGPPRDRTTVGAVWEEERRGVCKEGGGRGGR